MNCGPNWSFERIGPTSAELNARSTAHGVLAGRKVLIIVENLAGAVRSAGVAGSDYTARGRSPRLSRLPHGERNTPNAMQFLDGVHIYRHPLPVEARGALGFLLEYSAALIHELRLAVRVYFNHGFDVIHGCNPPDLIFLVALPFKLLGKRYIFDHHDIGPELYESKFNKRGPFWSLLRLAEWLTFKTADVVISTNDSYRDIAISRGGRTTRRCFRRAKRARSRPRQGTRTQPVVAQRAPISGQLCGSNGYAGGDRLAAQGCSSRRP